MHNARATNAINFSRAGQNSSSVGTNTAIPDKYLTSRLPDHLVAATKRWQRELFRRFALSTGCSSRTSKHRQLHTRGIPTYPNPKGQKGRRKIHTLSGTVGFPRTVPLKSMGHGDTRRRGVLCYNSTTQAEHTHIRSV
ncbi:Hypothetical protein CINCED_3A011843 [Cinara cedri]|uniref:Uncharacterized protein n=1 Tax=Cinara cedri TaxID=506608 RepID=A0A5E4M1G5_9HEMI|nr:Hypothetical protein CINCED_3A011843 [Cinara cedri]